MAHGTSLETAKHTAPLPPYVDIDRLENADKLFVVISWRRASGTITFCLMKEFERDGRREKTSFIPHELADSYLALSHLAVKRVKEITENEVLLDKLLAEAGVPTNVRRIQAARRPAGR